MVVRECPIVLPLPGTKMVQIHVAVGGWACGNLGAATEEPHWVSIHTHTHGPMEEGGSFFFFFPPFKAACKMMQNQRQAHTMAVYMHGTVFAVRLSSWS